MDTVRCEYPGLDKLVAANNPHILCADHGSLWFLGADANTSAYNGLSFLDLSSYELTSVFFDVRVAGAATKKLVVRPQENVRVTSQGRERFFFRDRIACYSFVGKGHVELLLDIRHVYDFEPFGREHEWEVLSEQPFVVRVWRGKHSFVCISSQPFSFLNGWVSQDTSFDARRSDRREWWSKRFASVPADVRIVVAPESRLFEAKQVFADNLVWQESDATWNDVSHVALASTQSLLTQTPHGAAGILAGLPWFFQIYTRDEAIAVGALLKSGHHRLAGRILLRQVSVVLPDGRIPNRFPHSGVGSADGVGWAFLRLHELYDTHRSALSNEQWEFVRHQLKTSLARLTLGCFGTLIQSASQETWMDTTGGVGDTRVGSRVEVQALTLRMLRFAAQLCKDYADGAAEEFRLREQEMLRTVQEHLFDGTHLFDGCVQGVPDTTLRPNALLARYIYPWLLSDEQWVGVADALIAVLDTGWGGLTTLSSDHAWFVEHHTGENDRSYHRGDSWFFLNNLIATALLGLDEKYRSFAERVYAASEKDLLSLGAAGHCSEISSAAELEALGCWCQAWSASSFVELCAALRR